MINKKVIRLSTYKTFFEKSSHLIENWTNPFSNRSQKIIKTRRKNEKSKVDEFMKYLKDLEYDK